MKEEKVIVCHENDKVNIFIVHEPTGSSYSVSLSKDAYKQLIDIIKLETLIK